MEEKQLPLGTWAMDAQDFRLAVDARKRRWKAQTHQPDAVTDVPFLGNHPAPGYDSFQVTPGDTAEETAARANAIKTALVNGFHGWANAPFDWCNALAARLDAFHSADLFTAVMSALCTWGGQREGWGRAFFRLCPRNVLAAATDETEKIKVEFKAWHGGFGFGSVFVSMEDGVPYVRFWNPRTKCSVTLPIVARPKDRPLRRQPRRPGTYRRAAERLKKAHWDKATAEGQEALPLPPTTEGVKEGGRNND